MRRGCAISCHAEPLQPQEPLSLPAQLRSFCKAAQGSAKARKTRFDADTARHAQREVTLRSGGMHGRQPLRQKTEQRQGKSRWPMLRPRSRRPASEPPHYTGRNPEESGSSFRSAHKNSSDNDKLFPQQHPQPPAQTKVKQGSIRAFPSSRGDHRAQDQKQQHLRAAADRLPQRPPARRGKSRARS